MMMMAVNRASCKGAEGEGPQSLDKSPQNLRQGPNNTITVSPLIDGPADKQTNIEAKQLAWLSQSGLVKTERAAFEKQFPSFSSSFDPSSGQFNLRRASQVFFSLHFNLGGQWKNGEEEEEEEEQTNLSNEIKTYSKGETADVFICHAPAPLAPS